MSEHNNDYQRRIEGMRRPLELHELEFRVQSVKEKGAVLLVYKTARTDMNRLDESGLDWCNDYRSIDGKLFCGIAVRNPEQEMVWKWDTGTESNQDAQKGEASDAFKRAGFRWGIGRELYDYPFIWANKRDPQDKFFDVRDWTWGLEQDTNGKLIKLAAKDKSGAIRFKWNLPNVPVKKVKEVTTAQTKESSDEIEKLQTIDHLVYTIGLAKSKEQVMDLIERSGVDPTDSQELGQAIENRIAQLR